MDQILMATTNANKVRELEAILGVPVASVALDLLEIQSLSVHDVIESKARDAFAKTGSPVVVEDTGLSFDAWSGLPGALVTWFVKSVGCDGLCRMLGDEPRRDAVATTVLGFYDGAAFHAFSGELHGSIAHAPRGANGFGWDTIFVPSGYTETMAEMTTEVKNSISMRRIAAEQLRAFLHDRGR